MKNQVIKIAGIEYTITGPIGQGGCAVVHLVRDKKNNQYALKIINTRNDDMIRQRIDAQIRIQKQFQKNKHVIQYIGFKKQQQFVYIVLELGQCSLRHWIQTNKQIWQGQLVDVFCSVCQGLKDIHEKKYMHRDIKPENIIKKGYDYKITDFGVSCDKNQDQTVMGTPLYFAPEILNQKTKKFTNKVDIWSLGVTIFEVYFKVHPFCPNKQLKGYQIREQLQKNIQQLTTPKFTINKCIELLKKKKFNNQVNYIQKKLKNTNQDLIQIMCSFFQPQPQKRPNIDIVYVLLQSLRGIIKQIPKTKFNQKVVQSWDQVPQDIKLFCNTKDLFYQINAYVKVNNYDQIMFAIELGIWYLEGANYNGYQYIILDCMSKIKTYRKSVPDLWKQVKSILSQYYILLKSQQSISTYDKINQLRMHILVCSVWQSIMKDDKNFCKTVNYITGLEIDYSLRMLAFLNLYSQKNIIKIQEYIISRYYDLKPSEYAKYKQI